MTVAKDVELALMDLLGDSDTETWLEVDGVSSFDSAGVLTTNAGVVLYLKTGERFQITIVEA